MGVLGHRRVLLAIAALAIIAFPRTARVAEQGSTGLVVVVSEKTPLVNLDSELLRRMYTGEAVRDERGNPLVPLNQAPGSKERLEFDRKVLSMEADEMARFWIDRKIRGQKGAPRSITPTINLARIVAKFPGTVGYLSPRDMVPGLKVIRVDGKSAGDAGYKLALVAAPRSAR